MLLQAGVDVNHARDGEAALLVRAVKKGNHAVVAVLYAWTLARDDPVQRYFLRFTDLPTTLPITDTSGCSLAHSSHGGLTDYLELASELSAPFASGRRERMPDVKVSQRLCGSAGGGASRCRT